MLFNSERFLTLLTTTQRIGRFAIVGGGFPTFVCLLNHFMDHGNIFASVTDNAGGGVPILFWIFVTLIGFVTETVSSRIATWSAQCSSGRGQDVSNSAVNIS
ncbi:hypothetical protein [Novipirellula caenicola]|uniref:Uncharacterized protein n=1 Tax=Novipirellula caenicola TaxID=1536901 RepID=A0ABP9VNF1_9BACT